MIRGWLGGWGVMLTATIIVGCGGTQPVAEPAPVAPAEVGDEVGAAVFPDSVALLLDQVESRAEVSEEGVAAEVRELFGERGAAELSGGTPSWDIPITMNDAVERWLNYFEGDGRENFAIYLERAGRYESMMRSIFRDAGLPEDLVYVSLIESGFSPRAYSRARAVGLWQFIAATGRLYGLQISYWVDERRDPILATKAAAAHLMDLYDEFGSWYLAAAAYNGGAGRVRRGINRTGSDDFWTLSQRRYLRSETRNYVPKLIAAALIAKQPDHYGFVDIQRQEPLAYDVVQVPDATSLDVIAQAAATSVEVIAELNPQILRGVTPPGQAYELRVPPGSGHQFALNYAGVAPSQRVTWVQHVVRRGDTLGKLARDYGVSVSAITAANRGVDPRRLRVGQPLIIPRAGRLPQFVASTPAVRSTASSGRASGSGRQGTSRTVRVERPDGPYITYTVQGGDSLWAIAKRYDVTPRDLMLWNGLTSSRIYPGDQVRIYVSP